MNPFDDEDSYYFAFGGKRWLGEVTISGHERKQQWNIKAAKGQDGASSSREGEPIGEFEVTFHICKDPQPGEVDLFAEWDEMQRIIESTTAGPKPFAQPVYHPDLLRNRYTSASNGGVGGMLHDGKGGATVKVKFIEHRPAKKKPVAKAESKGAAKSPTRVDPNAAAKAELEALRQQAFGP